MCATSKSELLSAPTRRTYFTIGVAGAAYVIGSEGVTRYAEQPPGVQVLFGILAVVGVATLIFTSAYLFFTHLHLRPRLTRLVFGAIAIVTWLSMVLTAQPFSPNPALILLEGALLSAIAAAAVFGLPFLLIWLFAPITWLTK